MYKKLSKKVRELKNLHDLLKEQFRMFGSDIRPTKAAGTRWIDHLIRAMRKLVDKFALYTHHLQNVIADTSKQLDPSTLQGKFNKLIESKVILRAAFLLDIHYVKLRKKMENDPEFALTLPTLASVISEVKKDNDTESWYQDQMLKDFNQAKGYTQSHAVEIVNKIIACFDERFLSVHEENDTDGVSVTAEEGDKIIFDVCQILNCSVWPTLQIEDDE